jgi:hypothetical protein
MSEEDSYFVMKCFSELCTNGFKMKLGLDVEQSCRDVG